MSKKLLSVREAAVYLDEHPVTVRQRLRRGEIKGTKFSDGPRAHWKISQAALDHFILKRTKAY